MKYRRQSLAILVAWTLLIINCHAQNAEIKGYGSASLGMSEKEFQQALPTARNCSTLTGSDDNIFSDECFLAKIRRSITTYVMPKIMIEGRSYLPSYHFEDGLLFEISLKTRYFGGDQESLELLTSVSQQLAKKYGKFDGPPQRYDLKSFGGYSVKLTRGSAQLQVTAQTDGDNSLGNLWVTYLQLKNEAGASSSF